MNLGEFINRCKLQVPNTNQQNITDEIWTEFLNVAVDQVNLLTKVYNGYTDFTTQDDKMIYNLSSIVPTYLGTDKKGLFVLDSNSKWQDVTPKTHAWISEIYPDYLNASSTTLPQWYWIDGDELGIYPALSSGQENGGRLYHLKKSTPMTESTHYPFTGSDTEITAFQALDDAIIAYVRWKISPAFGPNTDQDLRQAEFIAECQKGAMQVRRRRDLMHESSTRMRL